VTESTNSDVIYEPITAALIIGSVGVKQAEMTSEDTKSSFGKRRWMNAYRRKEMDKRDVCLVIVLAHLPADTNHPKAMVGTTMISKLLA